MCGLANCMHVNECMNIFLCVSTEAIITGLDLYADGITQLNCGQMTAHQQIK